jgi:hypothetical protein
MAFHYNDNKKPSKIARFFDAAFLNQRPIAEALKVT